MKSRTAITSCSVNSDAIDRTFGSIASINAFSKQADEEQFALRCTQRSNLSLVADALFDCSARGEIVLDSFLGSGTTLIAAERVGRICYGIEIDSLYVDVADPPMAEAHGRSRHSRSDREIL